ncbi:MAG: hypothetical protein KAT11_04125 [Phycisphaerae bacterium]|nr:hypothetical protein [Phycisphaerae bacterium]
MAERVKVLVTVKTYPLPSESYGELVCTAGVREDGSFIRLYPIDYRMRPYGQWYDKYQWIELEVEKNQKDPRPESFRPMPGTTITRIGKPILAKNNWAERKQYVLAKGVQNMCELEQSPLGERSLAIVRPSQVLDFTAEPCERDWKPKFKKLFEQKKLFGPQQKPLEKIPYKFSYSFKCEAPSCKGHTKMIEDWETAQLFRKMRDKHGEELAIEKVKETFLCRMCAPQVDTHFFVGTILQYNAWVILGVFWPKKEG